MKKSHYNRFDEVLNTGSFVLAAILLVLSLLLPGCSKKTASNNLTEPGAKPTDEQSSPTWQLKLLVNNEEISLPLKTMNVFLTDGESEYPETFEMAGNGVFLLGKFPQGVSVGYDEDWDVLIGKTINILPSGTDTGFEQESVITFPGTQQLKVESGILIPELVSGKQAGIEGDMTLSGKITLDVQTEDGLQTYSGTFAVQCVTWG